MEFNSIKDICDEFKLDDTADIQRILKQLTSIQKKVHPDAKTIGSYSEQDREVFTRIDEAKKFLRKYNDDDLVPISTVADIIKSINNNKLEVAHQELNQCHEKNFKRVKSYYLPRKITLGGIMAVVSFVWAFPSVITENPLLQGLSEYIMRELYMGLAMCWLYAMIICLAILFVVFKKEQYVKNLMYTAENVDFQYEIFSDFIHKKIAEFSSDSEDIVFTNKEFEKYIFDNLKQDKPRRKISHSLNECIREIIPKISDMILLRATEKHIITKSKEISWYDTYIINQSNKSI